MRPKLYSRYRGYCYDPNNPPLAKSGVYKLTHIASGRNYVGASSNLLKRLQSGWDDLNAGPDIELYGREAFEFTPLYYSLSKERKYSSRHLEEVEAELIRQYACNTKGYNQGATRSELLHKKYSDPEHRNKHLLAVRKNAQRPEYREAMSKAMRVALAKPEARANVLAANREVNGRPEVRQKHARTSIANWQDPEVRERRMSAQAQPEVRERMRKAKLGKLVITDGQVERMVDPSLPIPEGWRHGRRPRHWAARNQYSKR